MQLSENYVTSNFIACELHIYSILTVLNFRHHVRTSMKIFNAKYPDLHTLHTVSIHTLQVTW